MNFSLVQIPILGLSVLASSLVVSVSALSIGTVQAAETQRWVEVK